MYSGANREMKCLLSLALALSALTAPVRAQIPALTNVQHVVIFMQENRSFDHYFGTLKGVRGFADRNALLFRNGNTDFYQAQSSDYVLPFHNSDQCVQNS